MKHMGFSQNCEFQNPMVFHHFRLTMATLRYPAFTEFVLYTSKTTWILLGEACDDETGFMGHLTWELLTMLLCLPSNEPDRLQPLRFCHLLLRIAFTSKPGKRIAMVIVGMQLF